MSEPKDRARLHLGVAAALAIAMIVFCALRLRVTTDITHFLPAGTDHELADLSRQLADSALTRTLILDVGGADPAAVRAGAAALAAGLEGNPEVAWLERGPTPALAEAVYKLYAPRLPYFVSDHPETEVPAALSDAGLARAARALKERMSSPLSPMLARLAPSDPLQWFPAILRRFERARAGSLDVDGDQLVTPDRRHAIVFLGTRHSAFDSAAQGPLLADIDRAFADANRRAGGGLTLERAGVAPIAVDAERRMRGDLTRISVLSTVAVVLVLVLLLGSLRGLVLAFLPVIAGALTAATVGLLLFGKVHGMTLAIGSTLIGVAIDYPILLLTNRVLAPDEAPTATLGRVWIGALLGGLTTAAGFIALAWTSFPGVREMAVTSAAGILAALAVTRFVLPPLLRARPRRPALLARGAAGGDRALAWLAAHRGLTVAITALTVAICALGLPRLRWLDSLAALNAADPALKAETDRVRARVSRVDEGRLVVASAPDDALALQVNDAVADRLERARPGAPEGGIVSLHAFLWSADVQTRSRDAVAAVPDLGGRALAALAREGFKPEAFEPFRDAMAALHTAPAAVPPLRLVDLADSPLQPIVRPFVVKLGNDVGILTFLRSADRPTDVAAALADLPDARVFDQARFLDETYAHFRRQTLQAIGIGLALILLVLYGRYRRFRPAIAALLPATLAAAATLAILGAAGVKTNLLHVLSLLLVLSIGVDYGVFLVECSRHGPLGPTTMSLTASALTTMASFGLLAISSTPALRAIGLTTAIGISLSLLLAPTTIVMLRAQQR